MEVEVEFEQCEFCLYHVFTFSKAWGYINFSKNIADF